MDRKTSLLPRPRTPLNPSQLIALLFLAVIGLGTLLLSLPAASRSGEGAPLMTALFTSASAACVTGLSLTDTCTQWSLFGQIVLLLLMETGGLGFMSAASFVIFTLKRRVNMSQQMLMAQSIGVETVGDAVRIQKEILWGSLAAEGLGTLLLTLRFLRDYPFARALWLGLFHAVSAYCNAGFDLFGFLSPGGSLRPYGGDACVLLVLSALIIAGGLGFLVWDELFRLRERRKRSVYTRLVLLTTASLLLLGTLLFALCEWNNAATLGTLPPAKRLLAAFFQSVTTRTAGFAAIDQGALSEGGKAVTIFLMLIGGSSGSTAGGLKTVTFIVLLLFLNARLRGRESVSVFCRSVPDRHVLNALTVFGLMTVLSYGGALCFCTAEGVSFTDALFESVSALSTVGLSTGVTASLPVPARLLLILYMYFGRVGILTVSMGFLREAGESNRYKYAETNLLIG